MITRNSLEDASERIAPHIRHTPLTYIPESDLFIKWENQQVTGSFKVRGAFNKILTLQDQEKARGLVTASAGNHGQGVALAAKHTAARAAIFVSEHAVPAKIEAMKALGAEIRTVPGGYGEAEAAGLEFARKSGSTWISPYNDEQVIAGQGTVGLEICQDLPPLLECAWVVPAGGGGLISGVGAAIDDLYPRPKLVAVQSEASPFLYSIYHYGTQENAVDLPSLADGLAGSVEENSITITLVKNYVNEFILVTEEEISQAIAFAWHTYQEKIEGSAAAALAAVLTNKVKERPAVVVISGGNIQQEIHEKIVSEIQ